MQLNFIYRCLLSSFLILFLSACGGESSSNSLADAIQETISYELPTATTTVPTLIVIMNWSDYSESDATLWRDKFFNVNTNSVNQWLDETMQGALSIAPVAETSGTANDGIIMVDMGKAHPGGYDDTAFRDTEIKNAITSTEVVNNVDFAALDLDGDGVLNTQELQIIFIVAGGEMSYGDDVSYSIWAHQWSFGSTSGPVVDGVSVMQTSSDPAKTGTYARFGAHHGNHSATIGVIVHEMGHSMLNLGDYYDDGGGSGLGWYDVMSGGSWAQKSGDNYAGETPTQYSVYNRIDTKLTMSVTDVSSSQTLSIKCDSNQLVKLLTSKTNEYFLLECRDTSKTNSDISLSYYDGAFGEDRLFAMLYHVDTAKYDNTEDGIQTDTNHYKVALVEKDTGVLMTSQENRSADFDDVYIVGDTITSDRTNLYDGTLTGYSLEVTAEDTATRTMTIKITKN
ncbi:hypothetical protein [Sulfurimonas sp.]